MNFDLSNESHFFQAIAANDIKAVKSILISDRAWVVQPSHMPLAPLFFAPLRNRMTPIQFAALLGHIEIMGVLIQAGADLSEANSEGMTPLLLAVTAGQKNTVDYLLNPYPDKVSLSAKNLHGFSAFMCAIWSMHLDMAQHLFQYYPDQINLEERTSEKFKNGIAVLWSKQSPNKARALSEVYKNHPAPFDAANGYTVMELIKQKQFLIKDSVQKEMLQHFSKQLSCAILLQHNHAHALDNEQLLQIIHWPGVTSAIRQQPEAYLSKLIPLVLGCDNIDALVKLILEGIIKEEELLTCAKHDINPDSIMMAYMALALANNQEGIFVVMNNLYDFMPMLNQYIRENKIYSDNAKWLLGNHFVNYRSPEISLKTHMDLTQNPLLFRKRGLALIKDMSYRDEYKERFMARF